MNPTVRWILAGVLVAVAYGTAYFMSEDFGVDCERHTAQDFRCRVTSLRHASTSSWELNARTLKSVTLAREEHVDPSDRSTSETYYLAMATTDGEVRSRRGDYGQIKQAATDLEEFRQDPAQRQAHVRLNNLGWNFSLATILVIAGLYAVKQLN